MGDASFNYTVENHDIDRLSLSVSVPEDGYFYFGDGYSKD